MDNLNQPIEVMRDNKFMKIPLSGKFFWFNFPPRIILLIVMLFIVIAVFIYFYLKMTNYSLILQPQTTKTTEKKQEETLQPSLENEGKLVSIEEKNITLLLGTKEQTFTLTDSTIFYKCIDFNDINSCLIDKDNFKNATSVKVYSKGTKANFIQYK